MLALLTMYYLLMVSLVEWLVEAEKEEEFGGKLVKNKLKRWKKKQNR